MELTFDEFVKRFHGACVECLAITAQYVTYLLPNRYLVMLSVAQVRRVPAGQNRMQNLGLHRPGALNDGVEVEIAADLLWHPRKGCPCWINVYPYWISHECNYIELAFNSSYLVRPGEDVDKRPAAHLSLHEPFRVRGPAVDKSNTMVGDLRVKPDNLGRFGKGA